MVMTPSLPTLSIASAINSPISRSLPAIAPTDAMASLSSTGRRDAANLGDDGFNGLVDAFLDGERRSARGDNAQTFANDGLSQNGRGGGAVAGHVVGFGSDFFDQFRADIFERIGQFDFFGDGHAVFGDGRAAEFSFDNDVATLGAERRFNSVGDFVDATLKGAPCFFVKTNVFCHDNFPFGLLVAGVLGGYMRFLKPPNHPTT